MSARGAQTLGKGNGEAMNRIGLIAIGGLLSVLPLLIANTAPGGLMFSILAPLPLFLVGLGLGARACWAAGFVALASWTLLGGIPAALGVSLSVIAPVGFLTSQVLRSHLDEDGVRKWYPPGLLLGWLALLGLAWQGLTFAMIGLESGGLNLEQAVELQIEGVFKALGPSLAAQFGPEQMEASAAMMAAWGIGVSACAWIIGLLATNGILAQGILRRFGKALRPSPDLVAITLPPWISWALAVTLLVAVLATGWPSYLAKNAALVLLVPYFFLGLAVVHALARRLSSATVVLVFFYLAMVLWLLLLLPALVLLGMVEQWVGLRRRIAARCTGQEEE